MQERDAEVYLDAGSSTGSMLLIHPYRNYDKCADNSGLYRVLGKIRAIGVQLNLTRQCSAEQFLEW